jgi:hypothetical protein
MSEAPTLYRNDDGTVRLEWHDESRAAFYDVSPEIIEQMVETHNELAHLRSIEHDHDMPDTDRVPTEADQIMAGLLSTVWPMCHRHPEDAMHLAIAVNDLLAGDRP